MDGKVHSADPQLATLVIVVVVIIVVVIIVATIIVATIIAARSEIIIATSAVIRLLFVDLQIGGHRATTGDGGSSEVVRCKICDVRIIDGNSDRDRLQSLIDLTFADGTIFDGIAVYSSVFHGLFNDVFGILKCRVTRGLDPAASMGSLLQCVLRHDGPPQLNCAQHEHDNERKYYGKLDDGSGLAWLLGSYWNHGKVILCGPVVLRTGYWSGVNAGSML